MIVRTLQKVAAAGVLAVVMTACADSPTAAVARDVGAPSLSLTPPTPQIVSAGALNFREEMAAVCKVFTGSLLSYPAANFSVTFTGTHTGTVTFSLNNGQCANLGLYGGAGVDFTVTETAITNYLTSWAKQTYSLPEGGPGVLSPLTAPTSGYVATGSAYGSRGGVLVAVGTRIVFTNAYNPPTGCTYTQGYWKTHSAAGPAPYDDTWALLAGGLGHNTPFFLSGQTWHQVFWTAPAGNAYYNLAHQYMAARLNVLNGASTPAAVTAAIASATTLFNTYTPAQIGALNGGNALRAQFIALAGTLGSYNEGITGPGHCGA